MITLLTTLRRLAIPMLAGLILLISTDPIASATVTLQANAPDLDALPACDFGLDESIPSLEVGAVIYDFETGIGCAQNLDVVFPIASVPKLFINAAYQEMVMMGMISPQTTWRFDESYFMNGRGDCLTSADLGRDIPLSELAEIMITCSDNAATWMVMDAIGWDTVDYYVQRLGIPNIGPIIPYSEVDRLKLATLDNNWNDVPMAMASRYWRSRDTEGLIDYLPSLPNYGRGSFINANQNYFDRYDYNTASPRALADFFIRLRDDYMTDFGTNGEIASRLFSTMLLTQRQYTAQSFPGTVYLGAKNGFDTGLVAEANIVLDSLSQYSRSPSAIAIVFTRQRDLSVPSVQQPRQSEGVLNRFLRDLSPQIVDVLYPGFQEPPLAVNWNVGLIRFNMPDAVNNCWVNYRDSGFDEAMVSNFSSCLAATPQVTTFQRDQEMAMGIVLSGLNYEDTRLTFIFTAPDGDIRSYQTRARLQDQTAVNWFHPVDQSGEWGVDIYLNLEHVASEVIQVR